MNKNLTSLIFIFFLTAVGFAAHLFGQSPVRCPSLAHPMIRSEYGGMARDIPLPSDSGSDLKVTEVKIDPQNLPLRILSKPKATRTDGTDCAEGIVRLKVQFLSNGQLGKIAVVNGLSKGLNQDAITAARKIRFEAATKRGRAISVRRTVEYSFFIY